MHVTSHPCSTIDIGFVSLGPTKIAFLGILQGITELLPVSSTAHMRAIPALLRWPDPGSAFSAAMQLAALAAVVIYFWTDIASLLTGTVKAIGNRDWSDREFLLGIAIVVATIPIGIVGLLLSKILNTCNSPLRTLLVVGLACFVMAVFMGAAERFASHRRNAESLTLRDALFIGLAQVGALIPGFSRSGSALTAALGLGFKREDAARISFLLGIPAIALAGGRELLLLQQAGLSLYGWQLLGLGLLVSSISAYLAIWGLMRFLQHSSTWPLIIYRAVLGLVLVFGSALHWIG